MAIKEKCFKNKKKDKTLDRVDFPLLLRMYFNVKGNPGVIKEHWTELKNRSFRKKKGLSILWL